MLRELDKIIKLLHINNIANTPYKIITPFKKSRFGDNIIHSIKKDGNKRAILFLSGGVLLRSTNYVSKTIDNLISFNKIDDTHDLYIFNNTKKINFLCINDISNFLKTLTYDEITILGFSNGGICASQAIRKLMPSNTKYSLICVNSGIDLSRGLRCCEKELNMHPEIFKYYQMVFNLTNAPIIQYNIFSLNDLYSFMEKKIGIKKKELKRIARISFNLPNVDVHLINSKNDPVIDSNINKICFNKLKKHPDCKIYNHNQTEITHCTSMFTYPENFSNLLNNILCKK